MNGTTRWHWLLLMVSFGLLEFAPVAAAEQQRLVPVGVAKIDITPDWPVRMYGYRARTIESQGVAGPLKASALAIGADEGAGPAVLLCVDCGAVPADIREEVFQRVARKYPLRAERFVLANSHNHSGPNLKGMATISGQEHERLARYARELTDRLEWVVLDALAARRPAQLSFGQGSVGFATNRRVLKDGRWVGFGLVPEAPADHTLNVLRVTGAEGKLMAVVANYACHCTTLRGNFTKIHGDWAASAQRFIEEDHPGCVALITIGCGADSDPGPHGTVELCEKHGRALADEVARVIRGKLRPIQPQMTARRKILEIPYAERPPLESLRERAGKSWAIQRILEQIDRGEKPPQLRTYQITTWIFGQDLAMVFLSDEVVVDYVLRLQRELDPTRLWVTAYANDVSNYVVSKRLIQEGGYEVRNSVSFQVSYGQPERLQPPMEERIIRCVKSMVPPEFHRPAGGER